MVRLIRDEIVCQRAVGLSQGYGIPQLGIIVLSSTSYHSLPSRDLFPFSTPFFAESLFAWLDLACCFQGDSWGDAELAICDSVHVSDAGRPCNLAHLVRTILYRWHVKNFLSNFPDIHFHLFLPPAARICTRLPKIHSIPFSRLEPQLDYLFFELGLGFTSSGFTGCNMTLLTICCVFL
jgi:hypothetical protein